MSDILRGVAAFILLTTFSSGLQAQGSTVDQAQTVARLYSASLDRPPFTDGLNFFINSVDRGRTVISIAEDFVLSDEFATKYGDLDDVAYVERMFLNVLGRPGAQGGIDFWVGNLADGNTRAFVLSRFADSPENIAKTGILYDSMAFIGSQWQYSRVDSFTKDNCNNSGCSQVTLNGALAGASIVVSPLRNANLNSGAAISLDESGLRALIGGGFFDDLSDLDRLKLLGTFSPIQVQPGQLYLLTASGGLDFDNDQNQQVDANPNAVAGSLHAIVTADHLAEGMQVNVMTEAVYQSVLGSIENFSDEQVLKALDDAAFKLVKNINRDGAVDYLDVLQWRRLSDNINIRTDLLDVNKFALAVGLAQNQESLSILSNRMFGGAAAVGLDETNPAQVKPDDSCEGRSKTIINRRSESITTSPPTLACGTDDTGQVNASQGDIEGVIVPGEDGLTKNLQIRRNSIAFSGVDPISNEITIDYQSSNGNHRRAKVTANSKTATANLTARYQTLSSGSTGIESTTLEAANPPQRAIYGRTNIESLGETNRIDDPITDAMSYGALSSNWTACLVLQFVAQEQAAGRPITSEVSSWAETACTSTLAEVDTWVSERTEEQIVTFISSVQTVSLSGCEQCLTYIASPDSGANVLTGENILFSGVAPGALEVMWDFGDGSSSNSRTPTHSYSTPGTYSARFEADYGTGNLVSEQVIIDAYAVLPDFGTIELEGYFSYAYTIDECTGTGSIHQFLVPGEGLYATYYPESTIPLLPGAIGGSELPDGPVCQFLTVSTLLNPDSTVFGPQTIGPYATTTPEKTVYTEEEWNQDYPDRELVIIDQDTYIIDEGATLSGRTRFTRIPPIENTDPISGNLEYYAGDWEIIQRVSASAESTSDCPALPFTTTYLQAQLLVSGQSLEIPLFGLNGSFSSYNEVYFPPQVTAGNPDDPVHSAFYLGFDLLNARNEIFVSSTTRISFGDCVALVYYTGRR